MADWTTVKGVLDDPNVSMATKQKLMEEYDRNTFYFNDDEKSYAKRYIEGYSDGNNDGWQVIGTDDTDDIVKDAKAESDANGKAAKAEAGRKDKAQKDLDAIAAPAAGGVGAKSSDEQLDQGNVTLDFLVNWATEIWNKRENMSGALDPQKDIRDKFHENRGIAYQKFLTEADDLTKAHKVVEDTLTKSDSDLKTLFGEWKGSGAKAAQIKYEEKIQPHAKELQDQIAGAAKLIPETVTAVFNSVKKKADEVIKLFHPTVAQAQLDMAKQVLRIAKNETDKFDDYMKVATWVDSVSKDSNLAERLQNEDCGFSDENKKYGQDLCKSWVNGAFTQEFGGLLTAFNGSCKNAKDTIDASFGALANFMDGYRNQLTEAQTGRSDSSGKDSSGKDQSPGNGGTDQGHTGTSGTGGPGTSPSVAAPPPAPPAAPPPAAVEPPKPADGVNPITGKPLEVDPSTGLPFPIDPKTGAPVKDAGGDHETMTVQQGDSKISMSEPGKDGKMDVAVDDGTGHPKDYKLAFDDPSAAKAAVHPDGKAGDFGPQGAPKDGAAGADGTYRPGPDGKIHIQDGDLKITAEQPKGADGPTVVTVDNGKGDPATYTLDDNKHKPGEPNGDRTTGVTADHKLGGPSADGSTAEHKPGEPNAAAEHKPGEPNKDDSATTDHKPADSKPTTAGHGSAAGGVDASGAPDHVTTMPAPAAAFPPPGPASFAGDLAGAHPAAASAGADLHGSAESTAPTAAAHEVPPSAAGGLGGGAMGLADAGSLQPGIATGEHDTAASTSGLGATPGGGDPMAAHQSPAAAAPAGMSGMGGMMGGMGGAGGGGGGEQQRNSSQYRVDGAIFETSGAGGRISGSLDDEGDRSINFDR